MKQRFKIVSDDVLTECVSQILIHRENGKLINIIITDDDETRSQAQNRLYWKWVHILAGHKGWSDDEMHIYLKRKFLALIYARDDGEMLATIESLKVAKNTLPPRQYEQIAWAVADGIRSSQANKHQFSEYMNKIEMWAYGQGYPPLPVPSDLAWVLERATAVPNWEQERDYHRQTTHG